MKGTENEIDEPMAAGEIKKISTDNLNVGDIFRLKHELDLKNESICKLFDI